MTQLPRQSDKFAVGQIVFGRFWPGTRVGDRVGLDSTGQVAEVVTAKVADDGRDVKCTLRVSPDAELSRQCGCCGRQGRRGFMPDGQGGWLCRAARACERRLKGYCVGGAVAGRKGSTS